MITKEYLYQDISGDLFKITSKKGSRIYLKNVNTGNPLMLNELVFLSIFKLTNIEVDKYEKGLTI